MTRDSFAVRAGLLLGGFFLVAAFFYSSIFSKVYLGLGDGWCVLYAPTFFFKTCLSRGIFPLWNPGVGFGVPEWIAISPLSLDRLLLFFMSPEAACNSLKVFNFIFSGWLVSLYLLRRINMFFPVLLGGLVISIAQLNIEVAHASYFIFILVFFMAGRFINLKSYSAGLIFAVLLFVLFLNVVPQSIICATFFFFIYIAIHFRLHRNLNFRLLLLALFPFLVAFMMFSPQILRLKELLDLSTRALIAGKDAFFIPPWDYLQMIWPNSLMNSQDPSLNFIPGRIIVALQNHFLKFYSGGFNQAPYYGIFPFFALACLFFKRNLSLSEKRLFLFAIFMLFFPIINPIFYPITRHIPVINITIGVQFLGAIHGVLLLVVSVLTALSLGYLSDNKNSTQFNLRSIKKLFIGVVVLVAFFSLMRFLIFAAFHFGGSHAQGLLNQFLTRAFSSDQFHQTPEFYAHRITQISTFLKLWSSPLNANFYVPFLLIFSSIAVLYGRLIGKVGKTFFWVVAFLLIVLDAKFYHPMTFYSPKDLAPLKEEADFIKKDKTIFRVMALQDDSQEANDAKYNDVRNVILRPETYLIYGLSSPESYRSLVIKDYDEYMSRMAAREGGWAGRVVGEFGAIKDTSLLDLANIKYIMAPLSKGTSAFPPEHYERVYQTARCNIFKNKFSKERAFLFYPQKGTNTVIINEYLPHLVRLDVKTNTPNVLVLTDQYYPGWVAYVDGIKTPITSFQGPFRSITIPSGQHKIEFKFQPTYLLQGMVISLLGLIIGVLAVFCEKRSIVNNKFKEKRGK